MQKSSNIGTCLKYLHMHKILALAQNVGGLSKYRRQMYSANVCVKCGVKCWRQMFASNVGVKCWQIFEIYAANVGVQSMRSCKICAPHNIRYIQDGRWNLCAYQKYMRQMYASIRKLAPKLLLFGLGRISNFWLLPSLAEELSFRWCCLSFMWSSRDLSTQAAQLIWVASLPYCTGCCTSTTCQNICVLSYHFTSNSYMITKAVQIQLQHF